jgi:antitoxin (DNA-binding transcriptional repressor) of toxin-antitoxin stability system
LIDHVRAGESVLILDRGTPVARLVPAITSEDDDARLARLERAGIIRRGTKRPPLHLFEEEPPPVKGGMSAVEALVQERREGR